MFDKVTKLRVLEAYVLTKRDRPTQLQRQIRYVSEHKLRGSKMCSRLEHSCFVAHVYKLNRLVTSSRFKVVTSRSRTSDHDAAHTQTTWRHADEARRFRRRSLKAGIPVETGRLTVWRKDLILTIEAGEIVPRVPPSTFHIACQITLRSLVIGAEGFPVARPQMVTSVSTVPGNSKPVLCGLVSDREMVILGRVPGAVIIAHLSAHARVCAIGGQLVQCLQTQPEARLHANFTETCARFLTD